MEFIPTNDAFHHICLLLRIHKDKELQIELFARKGWDVSKSQLKAWATKTGRPSPGFRHMPREALDAFIEACHDAKLVDDDGKPTN